jgi:hypothetical protein
MSVMPAFGVGVALLAIVTVLGCPPIYLFVVPSPTKNWYVSVENPGSPAARVGIPATVPLLILKGFAIIFSF